VHGVRTWSLTAGCNSAGIPSCNQVRAAARNALDLLRNNVWLLFEKGAAELLRAIRGLRENDYIDCCATGP